MPISREKVVLLIDGPNLYRACASLGLAIDFKTLLEYFAKDQYLLRAYYFTAVDESSEFVSIRRLLDWLQYNGYDLRTKPTKTFTDATGASRIKGNMDVEITVMAMQCIGKTDKIVLFSGDGDFTYLVEELKRGGVQVTVVSTIETNPSMIADELRRAADEFIDLKALHQHIGKKPGSTGTLSLKK